VYNPVGSAMPDTVIRTIQELVPTLRVADLLDVLLATVIVYAVILWFRQARSRVVMSGLATLVAVYFFARLLGMTLTLLVYQVGITVAAVALVVVFQEEIRRAFERVAFTRPLDHLRHAENRRSPTEILVAAAFELAKQRTGALIVIKGKESLDRHLVGGVALGGVISEPLLMSVFDTSSAGHDGALVVQDDLASRFAVHLPLSQQITGEERFGTRHAAALGLSERSDAVVIVVSEERGEVSVAQGGKLAKDLNAAQVKERLEAFRQRTTPQRPAGMLRRLVTRDPGTKLLSLGIAVAAWFVVHGYDSQVIARTYDVPIVLSDVPDDLFVDAPRPDQARVTISGPQGEFRNIDPDALAVLVDASDLKPGITRRSISRHLLNVPPGVAVHSVDPRETTVVVHGTRLVELPIEVRTKGATAKGFEVTGRFATPASIRVRLAIKDVGSVRSIRTLPVAVDGRNRSFVMTQGLQLPDTARLPVGEPSTTTVRIEIASKVP